MKLQDDELKREFDEILEPLHRMPQRDPQKAAAGRHAFLVKADTLFGDIPPSMQELPIPVSETPFQRLNGWITAIFNPFRRKERVQMFSILTALVVSVTILFGGAGATVYAAQGSLPDQPLYPVKAFSEDLRVNLAAEPEGQVDLLLDFSDRRVEEIASLLAKGEPVPQEVMERFRSQMASAFQIAAGLDGDNMLKTMAMIQLRANNQLRIMNQAQPVSPGQGALTQEQARAIIRDQVRMVKIGMPEPQQSQNQNQFQNQFQHQQGVTSTITSTLPVSGTFGIQNQFQHQFQYQHGVTSTITGTVPITDTPGMQYGPYGPAGDHYQPGPDAGPGAGPGPGGEDGGSDTDPDPGSDGGNEAGPGEPDHDRDALNGGDNENAGGSDNGGSSDSGGDSGGGGGDSGGNGGGSGGGGGGN